MANIKHCFCSAPIIAVELEARVLDVCEQLRAILKGDKDGLLKASFFARARALLDDANVSSIINEVKTSANLSCFGNSAGGRLSIESKGLAYCFSVMSQHPGHAYLKDYLVGDWVVPQEEPLTLLEQALCGQYLTIEMFEILGVIGGGNFGRVLLARLKDSPGVMVVIKVEAFRPDDLQVYYARELHYGSKLKHKNVVKTLGYFPILQAGKGAMAIVQERCKHTLKDEVEQLLKNVADNLEVKLPVVCSILKKVVDVVVEFEKEGIFHRDLKPANILVALDGEIKVADFGLSRGTPGNQDTSMTVGVGTLLYMPPDKYLHDSYSIGRMFFEFIAGHLPEEKNWTFSYVATEFGMPDAVEGGTSVYDQAVELCYGMTNYNHVHRFEPQTAADKLDKLLNDLA